MDTEELTFEELMGRADPAAATERGKFAYDVALKVLKYLYDRPDYPAFFDDEYACYDVADSIQAIIYQAIDGPIPPPLPSGWPLEVG